MIKSKDCAFRRHTLCAWILSKESEWFRFITYSHRLVSLRYKGTGFCFGFFLHWTTWTLCKSRHILRIMAIYVNPFTTLHIQFRDQVDEVRIYWSLQLPSDRKLTEIHDFCKESSRQGYPSLLAKADTDA